MSTMRFIAALIAAGLVPLAAMAVTPVHKCSLNGAVTYQQDPCPSGVPRKPPTVQQLNAQRRQRLQMTGDGSAMELARAPAGTGAQRPATAPAPTQAPQGRTEGPIGNAAPAVPSDGSFGCDGRQYCSQMHSCAEARYFLAHCPGVKMDGNHDGVPCEMQWCRSQRPDGEPAERDGGRAKPRH